VSLKFYLAIQCPYSHEIYIWNGILEGANVNVWQSSSAL